MTEKKNKINREREEEKSMKITFVRKFVNKFIECFDCVFI